MIEILLDELDQAFEKFRDKLEKFREYVKHVETIPEQKRTHGERELVRKYGNKKKGC